MNAAQRRPGDFRKKGIIVAKDGNLLGNGDVLFIQRLQNPCCYCIVAANDGIEITQP